MNMANMQGVLIRAVILVVTCLGISVAAIRHRPAQATLAQQPNSTATHQTASTAMPPMIVLPTTVLPTISVRPSAAEFAAAMNDDDARFEDTRKFISTSQPPQRDTSVSLRSLRLDMPYYSFGKVLPRVSKE